MAQNDSSAAHAAHSTPGGGSKPPPAGNNVAESSPYDRVRVSSGLLIKHRAYRYDTQGYSDNESYAASLDAYKAFQRRVVRESAKGDHGLKNGKPCRCCISNAPPASIKHVHFPTDSSHMVIGGGTIVSYDRFQSADRARPRRTKGARKLVHYDCLHGQGASTSTYSERERLQREIDHQALYPSSPGIKSEAPGHFTHLAAGGGLGWVPTKVNELDENPEHYAHTTAEDDDGQVTIPSHSFFACCDLDGAGAQRLSAAGVAALGAYRAATFDTEAEHPTPVGTGGGASGPDAAQAEASAGESESTPEGVDVHGATMHCDGSGDHAGAERKEVEPLHPSVVAAASRQLLRAREKQSLDKAFRLSLNHPSKLKAWASLTKREKRRVRRARRIIDFAVDSGANVNTCNSSTAAMYMAGTTEESGISIGGLSANAKIDKKGALQGTASLDDGESLLLRHQDVHHCSASSMNLLSASKLTRKGIRCVFAEAGAPGGSYLLLPERGGERRRIPLIESNGLYFLRMEVLYPDEEDDMIEMFTFLAANDERRPPEHTVNDGGDAVAYSVAADLRLWHERLGHTHTTALKLIYRTGSIDDFEIEDVDDPHSASCKCPTCSMTKAKFVHMPVRARDFDSDEGRPLQHIVSDVKVIGTPSLNGSKYFVTFIDTWSRHCRLYFLQKKSDVAEAWAKYLAWSKHAGYIVETILTDNGGEFGGNYFSKTLTSGQVGIDELSLAAFTQVCKVNVTGREIEHILTPGQGHSDMNPIAERYNRKIMDIANAQLYHARLGTMFWAWSVAHATYLINRIPLRFHAKHHNSTPAHQLITRKKVSYSRVRTWGCDMYERLPNGPKSSEPGFPNARKLLYMAVSEDEKSYIGFDPESFTTVRRCMDCRFDEDMRNRTNNLRSYDARRKLPEEQRPALFNEWESNNDDQRDFVRSLYDLYDRPDATYEVEPAPDGSTDSREASTDGSPYSSTEISDTRGSPEPTDPRPDGLGSAGGSSPTDKPHSQGGEGMGDREAIGDDDIGTDSEADDTSGDDYTDDGLTDVSEDDFEGTPPRRQQPSRAAKKGGRARKKRRQPTDSTKSSFDTAMPTSFQRSLPRARVDGPLTLQRQRELADNDELEPSTLIRPTRFHKVGYFDRNRPQHLKVADRKFIKAAFENNYKIVVSQSHQKKGLSEHRFNLVRGATTVAEYIELATAYAQGEGKRAISSAITKATADFKYEYDRGLIKFPDRESDHHAHYCDADTLAQRHGVERVADLISKNQTNYYVNIATQSFNDFVSTLYHTEKAIDWIETKERAEAYGRQALEAFLTRAPCDLSAHLTKDGFEPNGLNAATHLTPSHYHHVRKSKDREHWETAMQEELDNCERMGTWDLIPQSALPPNADLVDCRWVFKIKHDSGGAISRWRARIVARGFSQRPGVDYNEEEVYAPVVSYDTLRTCLSIAAATDTYDASEEASKNASEEADQAMSSAGAERKLGLEIMQCDIKNAYLIGHLDAPIYMRQPPSHRMKLDKDGRPMVCALKRPLYGLKQSGHIFASVLHSFLVDDLGMSRLISDKCAFVKSGNPNMWDADKSATSSADTKAKEKGKLDPNGTQLTLLTYVDDITIMGNKAQVQWVMGKLRARFEVQELETGDIEFILSMAIKRDRKAGTLTLNQSLAIEKIAKGLDITTENHSVTTAMKVTPMTKLTEPESDKGTADFPYLSVVGALLHVSQCTRPDISYAVGSLARHSTAVGKEHVRAARRCVQYLYNTRHLCIMYGSTDAQPNEPHVFEAGRPAPKAEAYTDADYAMDVATRRSTSGGVIFLNGGPITWSSKLQKIVAMSTAEAEIIAATDVTKEIVHLRHLLQELGVRDDAPIQVHEDNQACILMGNGMKSSRAAKHYEVRLHFLQESIRSNIIKFKYCPTDDMIADCLTKPLDVDKFIAFRDQLLHTPG